MCVSCISCISDGLATSMANNDDLDIGNQILLEKIVKFCYQGDIGCRSCV